MEKVIKLICFSFFFLHRLQLNGRKWFKRRNHNWISQFGFTWLFVRIGLTAYMCPLHIVFFNSFCFVLNVCYVMRINSMWISIIRTSSFFHRQCLKLNMIHDHGTDNTPPDYCCLFERSAFFLLSLHSFISHSIELFEKYFHT